MSPKHTDFFFKDIPVEKYKELPSNFILSDEFKEYTDNHGKINELFDFRIPSFLKSMSVSEENIEAVRQFIFKIVRSKFLNMDLDLTIIEEKMYKILELSSMEITLNQMKSFITNSTYNYLPHENKIPKNRKKKIILSKIDPEGNGRYVEELVNIKENSYMINYNEYNYYNKENIPLNVRNLSSDIEDNPSRASNIVKFNNHLFNYLSSPRNSIEFRDFSEVKDIPKEIELDYILDENILDHEEVKEIVRNKYNNRLFNTSKELKSLNDKSLKEILIEKLLKAQNTKMDILKSSKNRDLKDIDQFSVGIENILDSDLEEIIDFGKDSYMTNIYYGDDIYE